MEEQDAKVYYNRVTVLSNERIDVVELAKAVKKFGTVSSVSSNENRTLWDD